MKFRQLELVRAVASTGTTTHGAELIGVTQSAVSRSIKELEDELGLYAVTSPRKPPHQRATEIRVVVGHE